MSRWYLGKPLTDKKISVCNFLLKFRNTKTKTPTRDKVRHFVANPAPKSRNFYNQDDSEGTVLSHIKKTRGAIEEVAGRGGRLEGAQQSGLAKIRPNRGRKSGDLGDTFGVSGSPPVLIKPSTQWFGVDQGTILRPMPRKDSLTDTWVFFLPYRSLLFSRIFP
jgi:hypothetical protein